jgi:hypothetical protein
LAYFRRNGWRIVKTVENENAREIRLLESILLGWIRIDLGLPSYLNSKQMGRRGGWTETFSLEGPSNAEVMRRIEEATDWVIHSSDSADSSTEGDQ